MLLQRLVEYANTVERTNTSEEAVPAYYARKPVRWSLDIDANGVPRGDLVDTANKDDPGHRFGVPRLMPSVTRTVGIAPALAVDNGEYVFGWLSEGAKPERVAKQHEAFRALITEWVAAEPDGLGPAIAAFYRDGHSGAIQPPAGWSRGDLIGFSVDGVDAANTPAAQRFWAGVAGDRKGSGRSGLCLVCGQVRPLLKTVPQLIPRRWVPGATQNASLVSVNEAVHGYELQKFLIHTPICADCGLKFMATLTGLLSDPRHSTALSGQNARLAWWVLGGSTFDPWAAVELDPSQIQELVAGPARGQEAKVDDLSRYCSVTVGGNAARVIVRDWVEQPIPQVKESIRVWFKDHEIVDAWSAQVVRVKVSQMVRAAGRFEAGRNGKPGKWVKFGAAGEDRPADLFHSLLAAALLKRPLPPKLLNHVINRIRTDGRLDTARAALIRLALRRHPYLSEHERERLTPTLNVEHKRTPAYVSGQIIAVMDDLQRTMFRVADQKLNTSFADRYFGRAIDNPRTVIVAGRRNVQAWLKRLGGPLERPQWSAAYANRLDSLFAQLKEIPGPGVLTDKAEVILGYHQERAQMRAERLAAAANKKQTDLPPEPDDVPPPTDDVPPTTDDEGDAA
ncbi:MAG TPA: type I-C CRISPR-associated protein Cas8c/Csd1 [Micromonosporaceae bacterium]